MSLLVLATLTLLPLDIRVGHPQGPELTAASALVMEANTGRILWGKNIQVPRYPASTTKIVTGLLIAEICHPQELIIAPEDIEKVRGSSLRLKPGESLTAHDMLRAVMLRSANDGSHAAALHISGSVEAFAQKMNERARQAGATQTTFYTPHGLNHPYHLTTALDLAKIARDAMKNERFRETVNTPQYTLARSHNTLDVLIKNSNNLFEKDPSIHGIKTGFTNPAGACFVGYNDRGGNPVVTVVLRSQNWRQDHQALVEWTYANYQTRPLLPESSPVANLGILHGQEEQVPVFPTQVPVGFFSDYEAQAAQAVLKSALTVPAPVDKGQKLAKGELALPDGTVFPTEFLATVAVDRKPRPFGSLGLVIFATLAGMTYYMRSRARKTYRRIR